MKIQAILCVCVLLVVLMLTPAAWAAEEDFPSEPSALEEVSLPPEPQETVSPEPTPPPEESSAPSDVPVEGEPSLSPEPTLEPSLSPEPEETPEPSASPQPEETPAPSASPSAEESDIIRVSVPNFGKIILNPYGLDVEVDGETSREAVISSSYPIINLGEVPVAVHVQAVGKISEESGASFSANPLLPGMQDKRIFMYAEFQNREDSWEHQYTGAANQIVITEQPSFRENILALDAGSEGYFRVFGEMAGASLWEKTDTVSASMMLSFSAIDTGLKNILGNRRI